MQPQTITFALVALQFAVSKNNLVRQPSNKKKVLERQKCVTPVGASFKVTLDKHDDALNQGSMWNMQVDYGRCGKLLKESCFLLFAAVYHHNSN